MNNYADNSYLFNHDFIRVYNTFVCVFMNYDCYIHRKVKNVEVNNCLIIRWLVVGLRITKGNMLDILNYLLMFIWRLG